MIRSRAESLPEDQLKLALEDAEQSAAAGQAASQEKNPDERKVRSPGVRPTAASSQRTCTALRRWSMCRARSACLEGTLHRIGEDVLGGRTAQFRIRVTRRPKYGCGACADAVVQAPARLIEGGLPTEATLTLSRWQGLCLFLHDGRIEIDNNVVERASPAARPDQQ